MIDNQVTLQINLSPGDINYAQLTVPSLVAKHSDIEKRLLIVDCCRPQKTKLVNPDKKYPLHEFNSKVEKIVAISKQLLADKIITDVHYLNPGDVLFKQLSKKYLRSIYDCTHGAGGTANMSYWAGIELTNTKYVLHYDGDLLLYQKQGYSWVNEALALMELNENVILSVPRLCPPIEDNNWDLPSSHEGRSNQSFDQFWINDFFSTRHFLLDKQRFAKFLPLVRGKLMIELLLRKYGKRAFPLDPEIVMFKSIAPRGGKRLVLKNKNAWFTHPLNKPKEYLDILPQMITSVNEGKFPEAQRGHENIRLEEWKRFLALK